MKFKAPIKPFTLMIFFAILTLISIATVIAVHQTPQQQTTSQTEGTYIATANYDYTAILNPSTLYQNLTNLKPDQGILYAKLTKQIDLTLTYTFEATFPTTISTQYYITRTLKTTAWQYQMSTTPTQTSTQQTIEINLPTYSRNEIDPIKSLLDNETGTQTNTYTTTSPYYTIEITPTFTTTATTPQGPITQTFTPALTIDYNRTQQGEVITLSNLHQNQINQLTQTLTDTNPNIQNERYTSYLLIAIALIGLALSTLFYKKQKTIKPKQDANKFMRSHKDLIVETAKNTEINATTTINLATVDELIKTAEILAKPIIHVEGENEKHTFYIIDNNIKYQYQNESTTRPPIALI
jgi:hypothetical protein